MHCLRKEQIASWLTKHSLPADPYNEYAGSLPLYLQFHAPKRFRPIEAFTREFSALAAPHDEVLVSVIDTIAPWNLELRMFNRLRPESAPDLLEAPGHLFARDEVEDMIAMFSLTVALEWKAYLYIPERHLILYNWEGEIFDFWTTNESASMCVRALLQDFQLNETEKA